MSSPNSSYYQPSSPTLSTPCLRQEDRALDRADALIQHRSRLEVLKRHRRMATFSDKLQDWIDYETPYAKLASNGEIVRLDAHDLAQLKGPWIRPVCPHVNIECSVKGAEMELHLSQLLDGELVDLFRATSHPCTFSVVLPPLPSRPFFAAVSESINDPTSYITEDGDTIFTPKRVVTAPANPRIPLSHTFAAHASLTQPLGNRSPRHLDTEVDPYMSEARKYIDFALVGEVHYRFATGFYERHPDLHPAALATTHCLLEPYDTQLSLLRGATASQPNRSLKADLTPLIREYTSPSGLPMSILSLLLKDVAICDACLCVFSNKAYNSHITQVNIDDLTEWRCKNSYSTVPVEQENSPLSVEEEKTLRSFARRTRDSDNTASYLQMPLFEAFNSWNSTRGVPQDVWAIISTASVECQKCHLARLYKEHLAHEPFCSKTDSERPKLEVSRLSR